MAHGIKAILIKQSDELECNNNSIIKNNNSNTMAPPRNNMLVDNCCPSANRLIQKSPITTTAMLSLNTPSSRPLNVGGATVSVSASAPPKPCVSTGSKMGSRRIFTPQFKLQVLESYRSDGDCKGNQRATARKYGIHRRQIQKWLQCENNLRSIIANNPQSGKNAMKMSHKAPISQAPQPSLLHSQSSRLRVVSSTNTNTNMTSSTFILKEEREDCPSSYSRFSSTNCPKQYRNNMSTKCLNQNASAATLAKHTNSSNNSIAIEHNEKNVNSYYECANTSNYPFYGKIDEQPIDLSCNSTKIKTELGSTPPLYHQQPANYLASGPQILYPQYLTVSPPHLTDISNSYLKPSSQAPNAIDLSCSSSSLKRKHNENDTKSVDGVDDKKPIKLFKPYLEENFGSDETGKQHQEHCEIDEHKQKFPIIWSNYYTFCQESYQQPAANQYENLEQSYQPFLTTSQAFYDQTSLVTPVRPSSLLSSPGSGNSYHTLLPPSQASPVSGYDSSTSSLYSFNDNDTDVGAHSPLHSSGHYEAASPLSTTSSTATLAPIKATTLLPSTLDDLKFKLHALNCYYNDATCKRNEKKVANKLNINCKILEKWLRQENWLRQEQEREHLHILA